MSSPALPELTYAIEHLQQYPTDSHSRLPICPATTTPKQQMNENIAPTPFLPVQLQWENTCPCKLFALTPSECTVRLEVGSINRLERVCLTAFDRGGHSCSKNYWYRPKRLMFAQLSQHSHNENMEPTEYISTQTSQVDTATRKISIPIFRPLFDIPVTTMLVCTRVFFSQRLSHRHKRLQDFHIPAQSTRL